VKNNLSDMSVSEEQEQPLEEEQKEMCRMLERIDEEEEDDVDFELSMNNRQRRHDYVDYQDNVVSNYNFDLTLTQNLLNIEFAMNASVQECDINQELQDEYDEKTKIREAIEHKQRHEEDENELFRILQRDAKIREAIEHKQRHEEDENELFRILQRDAKIREAIEHKQRHEEDENELFRILQRDATVKLIAEKLFALEDMRFEMVSCPKKSEELKLQYEEEQKKVYLECNFNF